MFVKFATMLIITIEGMIYVQIDACFLNFLKVITPALFKKSFEFLIIDMMSWDRSKFRVNRVKLQIPKERHMKIEIDVEQLLFP